MGFGLELKGLVNAEEELARLDKEIQKTLNDLLVVDKKLNNKQFLENAPKDVIEKQKMIKEELILQKDKIEFSKERFKKIK
jgi:valyl-tRNA synthetase